MPSFRFPVLAALRSLGSGSVFRRNFLKVAQANVVAQLILIVTLPLLSRLYSPEQFGVAALFMAALQIGGAFGTWKFDKGMPNRGTDTAAAAQFLAGCSMLVLVCCIVALHAAVQPPYLALWRGTAVLGSLLWWLPVALAGLGLHQLYAGWYVRGRDLTLVSRARIMQSVGYVVAALVAAWLGFGAGGLVLATTLSWWCSLGTLTTGASGLTRAVRRLSLARTVHILRLTFARSSTMAGVQLVNTISLTAPIVLLGQVYSATELGWYSLMMRLVATPLTIITAALALSFWSRAAELARENRYEALRSTYLRMTLYLLVPASIVLLVALFGPLLVEPVLGSEWRGAGPVLTALAPMLIGITLFSPTNHLQVLEMQGWQLIGDGARLSLMVLTIVAARRFELEFTTAVFAISMSSLIGHLSLFATNLFAHRKLQHGLRRASG